MVETANSGLFWLRLASLVGFLAVTARIILWMPVDDADLATGYAVVFLLIIWFAMNALGAMVGVVFNYFFTLSFQFLPSLLWSAVLAITCIWLFAYYNWASSVSWVSILVKLIIMTVPFVGGLAWFCKTRVSDKVASTQECKNV